MKRRRKQKPLPLSMKSGYGAAEFGMSAAELMLQLYLLEFYTQVVGLKPNLAGFALALAVFWDAVLDPAIGVISDRTRSPWGRRRPYIFAGSFLMAVFFALLFMTPDIEGQWGKFTYLLGMYLLLNTSYSLVAVPHAALGKDLSFDRDERTELFGWRMLFRNLGLLGGILIPGFVLSMMARQGNTDLGDSRSFSSWCIGATIIVTATITVFAVRRLDHRDDPETELMREDSRLGKHLKYLVYSIFSIARGRVFAPMLACYIVAFVGRTINTSLAMYYYKIRLKLPEEQIVINILALFAIVVSCSLVFWVWASRRFGKRRPAFWGFFFLGAITFTMYPLFPVGEIWPPMLFASCIGGFAIGCIVLFESQVADIVDYDELMTREKREGLYFGCWTMATKFARAFGLAVTGVLLDTIGFEEGLEVYPDEIGFRIALIFGPLVGVIWMGAALLFLLMPLTDERHQRIQRLLIARRHRSGIGPAT